jgi:hypothetical protein
LPFAYSLARSPVAAIASAAASVRQVGTPDRNSDYFGGTISYSYGQQWYLDLSYQQGHSSGNFPLPPLIGGNSTFTIDDNWYQAYIRYAPRKFRGTPLAPYLRVGISYVEAKLVDVSDAGDYQQTDRTQDILGKVGFGAVYSFYTHARFKLGLQLEGEGFYGSRHQNDQESLPGTGIIVPSASIDNDVYGGIGRLTVRLQYQLGHSGQLRLFADAGMEVNYTVIHYSGSEAPAVGSGSPTELLWGPYVKVGLRYSF